MANEVAKKTKMPISDYLSIPEVKTQINNVLGDKIAPAFISDVVACVQNNSTLSDCTNASIFSGALVARTINLPLTPTLGYAYLVPFDMKDTKNGGYKKVATFQMGYKGYVQLALRSGQYKKLIATDVRKGEVTEYDPFNDVYKVSPIPFEERIAKDSKGNLLHPVIGYYAKMELANGFIKEMFMPYDEMVAYAKKYSKAYRSDLEKHNSYSFWTTKFEDMAKKTMLRQLLSKWGLLTPELEKAYTSDMGLINEDGSVEYVDNQPDDTRETIDPLKDVDTIDVDYKEIESMQTNFARIE